MPRRAFSSLAAPRAIAVKFLDFIDMFHNIPIKAELSISGENKNTNFCAYLAWTVIGSANVPVCAIQDAFSSSGVARRDWISFAQALL